MPNRHSNCCRPGDVRSPFRSPHNRRMAKYFVNWPIIRQQRSRGVFLYQILNNTLSAQQVSELCDSARVRAHSIRSRPAAVAVAPPESRPRAWLWENHWRGNGSPSRPAKLNTRTYRKLCCRDFAKADLTVLSPSGSHCWRMPPGVKWLRATS